MSLRLLVFASFTLVLSGFSSGVFSAGNTALSEKILQAQQAAREVPKPNYGEILTEQRLHVVVPSDAFGDTSALEQLRSDQGLGDTATPGYEKALACENKGDPECLAVQLLRRGALNRPELSEADKVQIQQTHEDILTHADNHLGPLKDLADREIHCRDEIVTTPGKFEQFICDKRRDEHEKHCTQGFDEERRTLYNYTCRKTAPEHSGTCSADVVPVYQTEYEYACVNRPARYEPKTCRIPVTVQLQHYYPYRCNIKAPSETRITCTDTLNVTAVPYCTSLLTGSADLKPFLEVGWSARAPDQVLKVSASCSLTFPTVSIQFGRRTKARLTQPGSARFTDKIPFEVTLESVQENGMPYLFVSLRNLDEGRGTREVHVKILHRYADNRFYDQVRRVCTDSQHPGQSFSAPPSDAQEVSRTCTQGEETRLINGLPVHRTCWQEKVNYRQAGHAPVDTCRVLHENAACRLTENVCLQGDASACSHRQKTFECTKAVHDEGIQALPIRTEIHDQFDTAAHCQAASDERCREQHNICTAPNETRPVQGENVTLSCWEREAAYSCETQSALNTCRLIPTQLCRLKAPAKEGESVHYVCSERLNGALYQDLTFIGEIKYESGSQLDMSQCREFAENATCMQTQRSCEKSDENGQCRRWQISYRCSGRPDKNACQSLIDAGCTRLSQEGDTEHYQCQDRQADPLPPGISSVGTDSAIQAIYPINDCPVFNESISARVLAKSVCRVTARTCTEGPATKIVNGKPVTKECWKESVQYVCPGDSDEKNACLPYESDQNCRLDKTQCFDRDDQGRCTWAARTYTCQTQAPSSHRQEVCSQSLCAFGFCQNADDPPDADIFKALINMELARESAVYGDYARLRFFNGQAQSCRNKKGGVSCCEGKVRADASNRSGLGASLVFAADVAKETVKTYGSPFVYDVLSSHESLEPMLNALYGEAASGAYSPNLSYYGITVGYSQGQMTLSFSPAGFFSAVAVQVITDYLACDPPEQALQLKKGASLCRYLGSYCSEYNLGQCQIKKEVYCCFNSRLARIVQEAAHEQLNLSWGTPQAPSCEGITHADFMALDFSKIDLSEMIEAMQAQTLGKVNFEAVKTRAKARIDVLKDAPYAPMPKAEGVKADH